MNGRTNSNGVGTDTLQVPLDPPVNLTATAGNAKVSLTWLDPVDKYATPEGETAQDPQQLVSEWDYTVVVRKVGSQPNDPNDGTVVTKSSIRNQYQTSPYEDTGLINDTVYFYGVFAVNKDGVASNGCISDSVIPKAGVPVSTLSTGTIIKINENGAPVEYLIVHQGNPSSSIYDESCNGTWVLRKDIALERQLSTIDADNRDCYNYGQLEIHSYLNNTFINRFSSDTNSLIKSVKIPYSDSDFNTFTGTNGLTTKVFLLSGYEVGYRNTDNNHFMKDGTKLNYFGYGDNASTKRISNFNGRASEYWLRSHEGSYTSHMWLIYNFGEAGHDTWTNAYGIRPAFILNPESIVDLDMILLSAN